MIFKMFFLFHLSSLFILLSTGTPGSNPIYIRELLASHALSRPLLVLQTTERDLELSVIELVSVKLASEQSAGPILTSVGRLF